MVDYDTPAVEEKRNSKISKGKSIESFLEFQEYFTSKVNSVRTLSFSDSFESETKRLANELAAFRSFFREIPLLSAFLCWVRESNSKSVEELEEAKLLLDEGFIPAKKNSGGLWTLKEVAEQDPNDVFQAIRCQRNYSLRQRERLVQAYRRFLNYLGVNTNRLITPRTDWERDQVSHKEMRYDEFLTFADNLNEKNQLAAKLLYFGGSRSLDEVLRVDIADIDFANCQIAYEGESITYPTHVIEDIKSLIGRRSKGRLFIGRQREGTKKNAPLNHSTVFRNFKEAAEKIGISERFIIGLLTMSKSSHEHL